MKAGRRHLVLATAVTLAATPFVLQAQPSQEAKLEVKSVQFEPLQQGKNVVWMEVRNTSDQNQVFRTHVQTRSPDYGGGIGWGTGSFTTIPAGGTAQTRFVFKIQGPLTESTYVCLTLSNPGPEKGFDEKAWLQGDGSRQSLRQTGYKGHDLAWAQPDSRQNQSTSTEQTNAVLEVLRRIQESIRAGNYAQAWQLFTTDYQRTEFQTTDVNRLVKAMEPQSPMDCCFIWEKKPFLALQPSRVLQRTGGLSLLADVQGRTWTLDFVDDKGQWKLDWIAGYTPRFIAWRNWTENVLPKMKERTTEHFDIHFFENTTAARDIERISQEKERGYREICSFLGVDPNVHIRLVFFQDMLTKQWETGHQGMGWTNGQTIVEVHNEKESLDPFHETTHAIMGRMGGPPALFNEGFAVYMSQRLGAHALKDLGGGQATIEARVKELRAKGDWIELAKLMTYTEIGSAESRPPIAYTEAASFVKFLIDTYGKDKFLQAYKTLKNSGDTTVQARNAAELAAICGSPLMQLASAWEASL